MSTTEKAAEKAPEKVQEKAVATAAATARRQAPADPDRRQAPDPDPDNVRVVRGGRLGAFIPAWSAFIEAPRAEVVAPNHASQAQIVTWREMGLKLCSACEYAISPDTGLCTNAGDRHPKVAPYTRTPPDSHRSI